MQISPGFASLPLHIHREERKKSRKACARHTERKVWKVSQCEKTLAISQRRGRVWEINELRRAGEWQSSKKSRQRMKEEGRGGKVDLLSSCQLVASSSSGLTFSACVSERYDERVTRQAVTERLCVCLWDQISRQQCWYAGICTWIEVGRTDISAFVFFSPLPSPPPLSTTSYLLFRLLQ